MGSKDNMIDKIHEEFTVLRKQFEDQGDFNNKGKDGMESHMIHG